MTTRVLIIDDHPVVRAGIRTLLQQADGVRVVGQAGSGEEALADLARTRPDVVLCDLRLGAGLDAGQPDGRQPSPVADGPAAGSAP